MSDYYVNYNSLGQNIGHNSLIPHNIVINGSRVTWDGAMSKKTLDIANQKNLISHHVTGESGVVCRTPVAAKRLAELLAENPNYARRGV